MGGSARLLLLLPTRTYRTEDFVDAAHTLGVDLVCASEKPSTLEALAPDSLLTLDFSDKLAAACKIRRVDFVDWPEWRGKSLPPVRQGR